MKKALYIILLLILAGLDFVMMGLVWSNIGWLPSVAVTVAALAVLVVLIIKLSKTQEAADRKKIFRNIAIVMAVPFIIGMIIALYVLISLMIYIG